MKSPGRKTLGPGEGACAGGPQMAAQLSPRPQRRSLHRSELQMWGAGGPAFKRGQKSGFQPEMDRHTAGELPGWRVIRLFDGRLRRRQRDQKRPLGHRPEIPTQASAESLASGPARGELGFSCPVTVSFQTPGEVGTHAPSWKGCSHRGLMPCAPDSTLSNSYESSHVF